ncbi:hypothetical protein P4S72_06275 [Vibrio sp. PP-XX7]
MPCSSYFQCLSPLRVTPVNVNIAGGCTVLIPDSPQEPALREQLASLKAALS